MKINLLQDGYKNNLDLYEAFRKGNAIDESFLSEKTVEIDILPDFPIYMGRGSEKKKRLDFLEAFRVIEKHYLSAGSDIYLSERFWHSVLVTEKRDYIADKYPRAVESYDQFRNIVLKKFDWENYIYKCVLAAEYISDAENLPLEKELCYELIVDNLDLYNYIIKYPIFRNQQFLIKIITVVYNLNISDQLKGNIKGRPDLGKDERYGRRVIFEFNKAYPVVMSPLYEVKELEGEFLRILEDYGAFEKILTK